MLDCFELCFKTIVLGGYIILHLFFSEEGRGKKKSTFTVDTHLDLGKILK